MKDTVKPDISEMQKALQGFTSAFDKAEKALNNNPDMAKIRQMVQSNDEDGLKALIKQLESK